MQIAINERASWSTTCSQALTGNQLVLHYQPQQRLDGRMVGAEA
jgi:EAL domain-containing protein (putative c-di-GMP-specific phosphodiesterase class I)